MAYVKRLIRNLYPSDHRNGHIGSIQLNLLLAHIGGVPLLGIKHESRTYKLIFSVYCFIFFLLLNIVYTLCELQDILWHLQDLDALTQNVCVTFAHMTGTIKGINLLLRLGKVRQTIETLQMASQRYIRSAKQIELFHRCEYENKMALLFFVTLVGFTALLGSVMLLYNPTFFIGEKFPYRVILPPFLPLPVQLFYMSVGVFLLAVQIAAVDYMNIMFMNQIRFQLKVLNLSLQSLSDDGVITKQPLEYLKQIVQHHCLLKRLRNEVESIFQIPLLMQFLSSLVIFALAGFQATVSTEITIVSVIMYFYCCCILCELSFYCWFGNEVYEQSKTISTNGFGTAWYEFDRTFQSSMLIFLTNADQPFLFTAGGMIGLTLPTFNGVLSKSYSFIAVLRQFY